MAVTTTSNTAIYAGNGSATVFGVPFRFLEASHLVVTETDALGNVSTLSLGSNYSVSGTGQASGSITCSSAPASGTTLTITRVVPYTQPTTFRLAGTFSPRSHEDGFDRAAMATQQLANLVGADPAQKSYVDQAVNDRVAAVGVPMTNANLATVVATGHAVARTLADHLATLPDAAITAAGSLTARTLAVRAADVVNVKDFGAVGDGTTDDSAAIQAALASAVSTKAEVFFPGGTFVAANLPVTPGLHLRGSGRDRTTILSTDGSTVFTSTTTAGLLEHVIIEGMTISGRGPGVGTGHGIHMPDDGSGSGGIFRSTFRDLYVVGFGGRGIYLPGSWNITLIHVASDNCGDNLFEIQGGNTTTMVGCYAMRVSPGRVGYRIYGGKVTMIGCNGIDNAGAGSASWGCFGKIARTAWAGLTAYSRGDIRAVGGYEYLCITAGNSAASGGPSGYTQDITDGTVHWAYLGTADTGATNYARMTLIGCNVEAYQLHGLRFKDGSWFTSTANTFIASSAGVVRALVYDYSPGTGATIDNATSMLSSYGATFANGTAVHVLTGSSPFTILGVPDDVTLPTTYWSTPSNAAIKIASITTGYESVSLSSSFYSTSVKVPYFHAGIGLVDRLITQASVDRGDASQTLTAGTDKQIQRWATALTANRTVTLSTTGAVNGDTFRVVRTGLGAFTLDVGGLKTIPSSTAAFVDVAYDGTAWRLTGYGTL
jgi:hypothetical protein